METNMSQQVAFVSEQCLRDHMEDVHTFEPDFIQKGWVFGGVYDGHSSIRPAKMAAQNIPRLFRNLVRDSTPDEAFKKAYELTSHEMSAWAYRCGACVANFFIQEGVIHHANVGDAGIVVVGEEITKLTTNHRTDNETERVRITNAGGLIQGKYVWVGNNGLMSTRTLGDQRFKPVGITHEPSVGSYQIKPTDRFLVAGTDGLFDEVELGEILSIFQKRKTPKIFAEALQRKVFLRLGRDNLTIVVLQL